MENLILKSPQFLVKAKKHNTKAHGWKDLKPGDVLTFSFTVKGNSGGSNGRLYQSYIDIKVLHVDTCQSFQFRDSLNKVDFYLDYFDLERF